MQLKTLLVKEDLTRGERLKQSLLRLGHDVVNEATNTHDLLGRVKANRPDVVLIDRTAPDRDLLASLRELAARKPVPVVLFTAAGDRELIEQAVRAGVSAYVVDNPDGAPRLGAIIDVASVRFRETERLRRELQSTKTSLAERVAVDRAKGILMKQRGFDEGQAYHALRKMAMDKNLRIGQVAENIIAVAELLK